MTLCHSRTEALIDGQHPLQWMLEIAEARNCDPKARTVNLKFTRATLNMWQEAARTALANAKAEAR